MTARFLNSVVLSFCLAFAAAADAQQPVPSPTPTPGKKVKQVAAAKIDIKNLTAEQIVEAAILVYGFPGGRTTLNQIRKTSIERGRSNLPGADGKMQEVAYERYTLRAETLNDEKIRLDQNFPNAKYALVHNDKRIFGIFNDAVFAPREDATKSFENQIVRGLEALLRYKENGSTLTLAGREKILGVELFEIDVRDTAGRTTRFYLSTKSYRVMMLEYEEGGVKYRRKFYNYNYAQGTLVPYRSVLWAGDKLIEETNINTITFGQKVDEDLFKAG